MSPKADIAELVPTEQLRNMALFLDVDGTILDIAPLPEAVVVPPGLRESLAAIFAGLGGALALVSGRSVRQIDQLLKPLRLPASGEHGFEIRRSPEGPLDRLEAPTIVKLLRPNMIEIVRRMLGVVPEFKASTIAMHFRQVPALELPLRRALEEAIQPYEGQIAIQPGKMVFELKPTGVDKGRAIAQFMMAPPFSSRRPVFVGDDVTDEYGFAAVRELGGVAVRVGEPGHPCSDVQIDSPESVRAWLDHVAAKLTRQIA
jgi:trehalose 6-phosphate phosphatase